MIPFLMTALLAAACTAQPPGTDGDLANGWPSFAEPVSTAPVAGTCFGDRNSLNLATDIVDCKAIHLTEVVYVGHFTGDAATLDRPPSAAKEGLAQAWHDCDHQAITYVGGPWTDGALRLDLVLPKLTAWENGDRWFRCDLYPVDGYEDAEQPVTHAGSLRGHIPTDLLMGCVQEKRSRTIASWRTRVPCGSPHNAEFGVRTDPVILRGVHAFSHEWWSELEAECMNELAPFLAVPIRSMDRYGVDADPVAIDAMQWNQGMHTVRCFLWLPTTIRKSAKNSHGKGIPTL